MEIRGNKALATLALCVLCCGAWAQTSPSQGCAIDAPSFVTNSPNIFNDRQEQDLGDALAEYFETDMSLAPPAADDQLTRIGERLLATLPPTGIHYRFRVYDSGEINGFSVAGGRVYISRKLIAAVKSEDELAGVVAHEIGHIATHQSAIEITRLFRIRLHVTQVTDRADVFAKLHLFFSTPGDPILEEQKDEKGELAADHIALYAMARAGYAVESFPSFFDKISMNKGKTGNWLSEVMGATHEATQRYRSALKLVAALPAGCSEKRPTTGDAFQAWQRRLVEERVTAASEGLSGDRPLTLESPLRPSLWRIRFSQDGRYLLAQDEGSITVVDKNASKALFRIDAPDVEGAQFTPDSKEVVFHDANLRVERWSIATGQRTSVKEIVVLDGCVQTRLVQDGKTLLCVNASKHHAAYRLGLRLIDVDSGKPYFDNPNFYEPDPHGAWGIDLWLTLHSLTGSNVVNVAASPGGRYLLVSVEYVSLAYDLEKREVITLGGKLKSFEQTRMAFVAPDQIFMAGKEKGKDLYQAHIFSFPDGAVIKETEIGGQQIEAVTKGPYLAVRPLKDHAVGILDTGQAKFRVVWKFPAIDVWDSWIAAEDATGGLGIAQLGVQGTTKVALPLGPLPRPRDAVFSPDGKYLAVSLKGRAEIWNLDTGKEVGLMRPFTSAWMDGEDNLFGQFPKYLSWEPSELQFSMAPLTSTDLAKLDDDEFQYRDMEYRFKPLGSDKVKDSNIRFEVKKMLTQVVAWSRDYPHERPACWSAEDDRMVLGWDLSSETAKDEIKRYPGLQRQMDAFKDKKKGLLVETVVPETGAPLQQVIIPEPDLTGGWDDARQAVVSGDFVLARGEHGNTAIYRMNGGAKVGEFFGSPVATAADLHLIAAVNRENEILLVDMQTGKELRRFTLDSPVRVAHIVAGKEKMLQVLTADQVVHRLPLPE